MTRIPFRTYVGFRDSKRICRVYVIDAHGDSSLLPLRLDLYRHSPTGFEWGYGGSGPAQLALAILADVFSTTATPERFNNELAIMLHQEFKRKVIAKLDRERPWRLKEQDVIEHVRQLLATDPMET